MKEVQIRFSNNGDYDFHVDLTGKVVTARQDSGTDLYYVSPEELVRIGADPHLAHELRLGEFWSFTESEVELVSKRYSRAELLEFLDIKAPLSKRIRRMIKWSKRK